MQAADAAAARATLDAVGAELQALASWRAQELITAQEWEAQTSQLLKNKLPPVDAHGAVATLVLQELSKWRTSDHLADEVAAVHRQNVLTRAVATPAPAPRADTLPASDASKPAMPRSFASHRGEHHRGLSVRADAPISPHDESPQSSGALTRKLLHQASRARHAIVGHNTHSPPMPSGKPAQPSPDERKRSRRRSRSHSREELAGCPVNRSWAQLNRCTQSAHDDAEEHGAGDRPASSPRSADGGPDLAQGITTTNGTGEGSCQSSARTFTPTAGLASGEQIRRRRFSVDGVPAAEDDDGDVTADLTELDLMLNLMRKESSSNGRAATKSRSRFNLLATDELVNQKGAARSGGGGGGGVLWRSAAACAPCAAPPLISRLHGAIPVFHPEGRGLTMWHVTICSFVITSAVVVPLMVAFESEMPQSTRASLARMDICFDVAFLLDIIISANIAYRRDGFLVTSRRLIWRHYLRSWFALDFVSSFPLSWIVRDDVAAGAAAAAGGGGAAGSADFTKMNKLLRLLKLGKLLRILKLFKIFDRLAEDAHFNPASFRLLALVFALFFMSHLFGCLWYMVLSWGEGTLYEYERMRNGTWDHEYDHGPRYPFDELIEANKLGAAGVTRKWLLCFTWAVGMFTGLLPIQVHPWREEEMAFTIIALVFAMGFNAMIISSCSSLMAAMDYLARHHKAKLDRVRDYMRFNQVPADLSHTILEYYKYICLNAQSREDVKDFVDLPQQLHLKLIIALHRELITKCPLMTQFDNNSILRMLSFLRPFTLPPETVVLRQGKPHNAMFFVGRGMLWAVENFQSLRPDAEPERHLATIEDHDFFGDEGVLSGAPPRFSVVAKTYCVLMAITRQDFETASPRIKGGPALRDLKAKVTSLHSVVSLAQQRPTLGGASQPGMRKVATEGAATLRLSRVGNLLAGKRQSGARNSKLDTRWEGALAAARQSSHDNSRNPKTPSAAGDDSASPQQQEHLAVAPVPSCTDELAEAGDNVDSADVRVIAE